MLLSTSVVDDIALWRRSKYVWRNYGAAPETAPVLTRKMARFISDLARGNSTDDGQAVKLDP